MDKSPPAEPFTPKALCSHEDMIQREVESQSHYDGEDLYFNAVRSCPCSNAIENRALVKKWASAKTARTRRKYRNILVERNLFFVAKIAKLYEYKGVGILDLMQEGAIGLCKGIEKYKARSRASVTTYAAWWIRHYMGLAISHQQGMAIRIKPGVFKLRRDVTKFAAAFEHKHGRPPTDEEISRGLRCSSRKGRGLRWKLDFKVTLVPLDSLALGTESEGLQHELIPDRTALSPSDEAMVREEFERASANVRRILAEIENSPAITPRERRAVQLKFGLNGNAMPQTFKQIGRAIGYTGTTAENVVDRALMTASRNTKSPFISHKKFRRELDRLEMLADLAGKEIDLRIRLE